MATQVQFRGGTTTEHSSFNGVAREVTVDTTKKTLVVQDGSTNGGFPLLRQDLDNLPAGTIATADIADLGVTTGKIADLGVTTGKIAADAVTEAKIANDAVGAEHIEDLDGDVKWLDTKRAVFGTDNDCKIHFNGTKTWIDVFTGDFGIAVSNASDHSADFIAGGGVKLYWDGGNNPKFETTSGGATVTGTLTTTSGINAGSNISMVDNVKVKLGTGDDLQLYHNGSNNYIQYANGNLVFKNGTEADAACVQFDSNGDLYVPDDALIYLGGSADLKIKHDSVNGNSVIENITGSLGIQSDTLYLQDKTNSHAYITAVKDGAVGLRYDNSQKFATDADGVTVYDYGNNTVRVRMESAQGNAGSFYGYTADGTIGILTTAGEWGVKCTNNGASSLHHDGNGILQTSTNGILINTATAGVVDADNLTVSDSANCGITIRSGDDDYGNIFFSDATSGGGTYAGYIQYNHSSNGLNFGTNETHNMSLDSAGRLGIGASSPGNWHSNADDLVISRAGNAGISIDSTSSSASSIYFGDGTTGNEAYKGFIEYHNNTDKLSLGAGHTTGLVLTSDQDVGIGTSSPTQRLDVRENNPTGGRIACFGSNGTPATSQITGVSNALTIARAKISVAANTTTDLVGGYGGSLVLITLLNDAGVDNVQMTFVLSHGWNGATQLFYNTYGTTAPTMTFTCASGVLKLTHNHTGTVIVNVATLIVTAPTAG